MNAKSALKNQLCALSIRVSTYLGAKTAPNIFKDNHLLLKSNVLSVELTVKLKGYSLECLSHYIIITYSHIPPLPPFSRKY